MLSETRWQDEELDLCPKAHSAAKQFLRGRWTLKVVAASFFLQKETTTKFILFPEQTGFVSLRLRCVALYWSNARSFNAAFFTCRWSAETAKRSRVKSPQTVGGKRGFALLKNTEQNEKTRETPIACLFLPASKQQGRNPSWTEWVLFKQRRCLLTLGQPVSWEHRNKWLHSEATACSCRSQHDEIFNFTLFFRFKGQTRQKGLKKSLKPNWNLQGLFRLSFSYWTTARLAVHCAISWTVS